MPGDVQKAHSALQGQLFQSHCHWQARQQEEGSARVAGTGVMSVQAGDGAFQGGRVCSLRHSVAFSIRPQRLRAWRSTWPWRVRCSYLERCVAMQDAWEGANSCRLSRPWPRVSNPSRPGPLSSGPMGRVSPALNLQYHNGQRYPEIDFNKMMSISTPEAAVRKGGFARPVWQPLLHPGTEMWQPGSQALTAATPAGGTWPRANC